MNFKIFLCTVFLLLSCYVTQAKNDSLHIEIEAPQLKGQQISLCYYFDGNIYKQDSLLLSSDGKGIFHRKENLQEGLYLILISTNKYFDLLLADDQSFHLAIDTTHIFENNQIRGADQSEAFLSHVRFIQKKREEREKIIGKFQALPENEKDNQVLQNKLDELNGEVIRFQENFKTNHEYDWVGRFFYGLEPVQTGPFPTPKSREEGLLEFQYQKDHCFDNINLKDRRFWRTNYFPEKITTYMNQQVEQIPDSLANAASRLVSKTLGDSLCFQLMLRKLINYSASSLIMGMENVWARLAEDYYFTGLASWADSTHRANIQTEYTKIKYNRIGMKAFNLELQDSTGVSVKLYDIGKKYTLLYFYEPSCGHCKKETPLLHETLYKKYAAKGLDIACICILKDKAEWMNFIQTHQLEGEHWHNLWDPDRKSYFWQFYDTSTTPAIYILDENKKIIAKKLSVETMDKLFNSLLENINE